MHRKLKCVYTFFRYPVMSPGPLHLIVSGSLHWLAKTQVLCVVHRLNCSPPGKIVSHLFVDLLMILSPGVPGGRVDSIQWYQ